MAYKAVKKSADGSQVSPIEEWLSNIPSKDTKFTKNKEAMEVIQKDLKEIMKEGLGPILLFKIIVLFSFCFLSVEAADDCQYLGSSGGVNGVSCEKNNCTMSYSVSGTILAGQSFCFKDSLGKIYKISVKDVVFGLMNLNGFKCAPFKPIRVDTTQILSKGTCFEENEEGNFTPPIGIPQVCCRSFKCKSSCGDRDCHYAVKYTFDPSEVYTVYPVETVLSDTTAVVTYDGIQIGKGNMVDWVLTSTQQNPAQGKFVLYNEAQGTWWYRVDALSMGQDDYCAIKFNEYGQWVWSFPMQSKNRQSTCLTYNLNKPYCDVVTTTRKNPGEKMPYNNGLYEVTSSGIRMLVKGHVQFSMSVPGSGYVGIYNRCPVEELIFERVATECPKPNIFVVKSTCMPQIDSPDCIIYYLNTTGDRSFYSIQNGKREQSTCEIFAFNSESFEKYVLDVDYRLCETNGWENPWATPETIDNGWVDWSKIFKIAVPSIIAIVAIIVIILIIVCCIRMGCCGLCIGTEIISYHNTPRVMTPRQMYVGNTPSPRSMAQVVSFEDDFDPVEGRVVIPSYEATSYGRVKKVGIVKKVAKFVTPEA